MDTHPVPWAGRHHLVLITDNLEHTTRLWHGVTGAFFGYHGHQVDHFAKPTGTPDARAMPFDHVSLPLSDDATRHRLRQRHLVHGWVFSASRGGVHQGHDTPERTVSTGGNE